MRLQIEFTTEELDLIREALQDAMVFRDSRSRVMRRAVRLNARPAADAGEADRDKSREYEALARKLGMPRAG